MTKWTWVWCVAGLMRSTRKRIGEELYLAVSQLVPSVNVELLIRSEDRTSTLLTWRADQYYGPGWHVPGGVIRFKEEMKDRVEKVARRELNRELASIEGPIGFHEMFNHTRDIRGIFCRSCLRSRLPNRPMRAGRRVMNPRTEPGVGSTTARII